MAGRSSGSAAMNSWLREPGTGRLQRALFDTTEVIAYQHRLPRVPRLEVAVVLDQVFAIHPTRNPSFADFGSRDTRRRACRKLHCRIGVLEALGKVSSL